MTEKRYKETSRDLLADYDESKFDRVGSPLIGIEHGGSRERGDGRRVKEQKKTHTLKDMSKDYEFFTTGPVHACSPLDRDPVAEYVAVSQLSSDVAPVIIDYSKPFFHGLGDCNVGGLSVNMDRRLYAVPRESWEDLRDMIAGICMVCRKTGFYGQVNFSEIPLIDQFSLSRGGVIDKTPIVPVTVFGVSSNKSFAYLQPPETIIKLPVLVKEPPKQEMLLRGQQILSQNGGSG